MVELDRSAVFRIISLTLAGGDVLQTIPGTFAMYRKQWKRRRLSSACLFYAIARYMTIASLIVNGAGAFSKGYTPESCRRWYMFPNVTALLAGMAVQVIVFLRTYAISCRSNYVFYGLGALMLLGFPVQTFGIVYHRDPSFHDGACKGKVFRPGEPDWNIVYYTAHMVFDLVAGVTATCILVNSSRILGVIHFSKLRRHVLRDGLLYFLVVFLVNFWVVLEFAHVFKSGAASTLPLAVVLIAIQHLTLSTQHLPSSGRAATEDSVSRGPPRFVPRPVDVELESVFVGSGRQSVFVGSGRFVDPRDQKTPYESMQTASDEVRTSQSGAR